VIAGVPFVRFNDASLLRLDIPGLYLEAFGGRFPIEDLSLFLLLCIALVLLFLLVTLVFGRAWCGWACPQTALVDLVEWTARRIGIRVSAGSLRATPGQSLALHLVYLLLAVLVGANLAWYFVSPYAFFSHLLDGTLHGAIYATIIVVAVTIYLDLALLRRTFCKEFCPYGRFQTVLVDPATLVLHAPPDEAPRCIDCGACVRACPTGIDIRRGYQIECINCGRCLDACREVMSRRQQPGIIRYTFGFEGRGFAAHFNLRTGLVTLAICALATALILSVSLRPSVILKAGRNAALPVRYLADGDIANFFTLYLDNRDNREVIVDIATAEGSEVTLTGETARLHLAPRQRRRVDLALLSSPNPDSTPRPVELFIRDGAGNRLDQLTIYLNNPLEHHD